MFFRRIGLLGCGYAIGVAELEPDEVARSVNLIGGLEIGNGGIKVAGIGGDLGRGQLLVQLLDCADFLLLFLLRFLLSLDLFRSQALALGGLRGLLFQVEVEGVLIQRDRNFAEMEKFLVGLKVISIFVESDGVGASSHAERKILALLVGFEGVFLAVVLVGVNHDPIGDRDCHRCLCKRPSLIPTHPVRKPREVHSPNTRRTRANTARCFFIFASRQKELLNMDFRQIAQKMCI